MRYPVLSFSSGELSPQIDARSDVDKYRAGCRTLSNMIPRAYGTAERRPGTKYIDTCNGVARVVPFIYSNSVSYIVLLEDLAMYFYYDGARVLDSWGRRLKLDTPYLAADLFEIQYKQVNDVMWLVHPDYAPRKLQRTSANSFTLTEITFEDGPFKTRNDLDAADGVTMTPSVTTGSGTLTASSSFFAAGHVGALFSVTQPRVNTNTSGSLTTPTTGVIGSALVVEGAFTLNTHGTWTGTVALQRSIDGTNWETYRTWTSASDRNVQYTGSEEEDDIQYRINATSLTSGTVNADLTVNSSTQTGICRVTAYVSETEVSMDVVKDFASTDADVRWSEGCWSPYRGYPTAVTFFEDRCVYAGTTHQPQTIWLSATDDYEHFEEGTDDDDAFSLTLSSDTRNAIQWISPLESLILGTSGGEWRIGTGSDEQPLTPTNFSIKQHTTYGSKAIQALPVNDAILFVDPVGRKVREISYNDGKGKYVAPDLTALAEHITDSGITSIAYQKNPDPILWATLTDGTLLSMTYEREMDVVAWAKHPMKVGPGTSGELTGGTSYGEYPTLQDLTAAEIPDAPSDPVLTEADTAVSNATELQAMNGANKYYLTQDIDLTGVTWTPIANFSGVLDGRGYTISNLTIDAAASSNQGLFATLLGGAEIYDLTFDTCSVTALTYCGILAAQFYDGNHIVKDVNFVDCTLSVAGYQSGDYGSYAGLLFGKHATSNHESDGDQFFDITATNCIVTGTRAGLQSRIGMLVGGLLMLSTATADTNFVRCVVSGGTVSVNSYAREVGGIGGWMKGPVDSYAWFDTDIWLVFHGCTSSATLSCAEAASVTMMGGFAGFVDFMIKLINCSATGTVNLPCKYGDSIGGFIGDESCQATNINSYSTGSLTAGCSTATSISKVGGFIGRVGVTPRQHELHCWSTTDVDLVGKMGIGTYTTFSAVGGFAGMYEYNDMPFMVDDDLEALIERCWSTGDVTIAADAATAPYYVAKVTIGGFAGLVDVEEAGLEYYGDYDNFRTILQNCYAWGSINFTTGSVDYAIGGLIGKINAHVDCPVVLTNCYCAQTDTAAGSGYTDQLPEAGRCGGLVGYETNADSTTDTATFWDTETSGQDDSVFGTGHETDWMQTQSNYEDAGWDFDTVWQLTEVDTTYDYTASGLGPNSVAVIPSTTEDEVWLVVYRVVNGQPVRYLEQMQPRAVEDQEDMWFVDSGLDYDGDEDTTFSGLDHLEGEEVYILADGAVHPPQTVTSGAITLTEAASRVIVGLPFRYELKPMRFDLQVDGTTKGSLKRIAEVVISFYRTLNAEYGTDTDNLFNIDWRTEEAYGSPPALFTGDKVVAHEGGFSVEDEFVITGNDPMPCVVRAIVPRIEVVGR